MSDRKTRVLMVGEFSAMATGYSTYGREVMKRLHATDKFQLCELACYGSPEDPRRLDLPWGYLPNLPSEGNGEAADRYRSNLLNEFGMWRFEEACLAFKPDVVWSFRDWWNDEYIERSPFRQFFHFAHMPTVDAEPLDDQWLSTYQGVDGLFAYTDWGVDVLRRHGMNPICSAPPGADTDVFKPVADKAAHRRKLGLPEDCLVVGTVMRNQARKLFPDLIDAFALFLREAPKDLADRALLYLHTGFPDQGWNLPRLIKDAGVGNRTLLTYSCGACGAAYPDFFRDAVAACRTCKAHGARPSDSNKGVGRDVLAAVYNTFDVHVQLSVCEGFGMPQVEAAACGVTVAATDYSAMSDVVRKVGGYPIKVQRFFREAATHRLLALPDNRDLVNWLIDFLGRPEPVRRRAGMRARQGVLAHYTYDRTAKIWEDHFSAVRRRPLSETWGSPARTHTPARNIPEGLSDEQFVRWALTHVGGRPDLADGYTALRLARDLGWGSTHGGMGGLAHNDLSAIGLEIDKKRRAFTRDDVLNQLLRQAEEHNHWERKRTDGTV